MKGTFPSNYSGANFGRSIRTEQELKQVFVGIRIIQTTDIRKHTRFRTAERCRLSSTGSMYELDCPSVKAERIGNITGQIFIFRFCLFNREQTTNIMQTKLTCIAELLSSSDSYPSYSSYELNKLPLSKVKVPKLLSSIFISSPV